MREAGKGENRERLIDKRLFGRTKKWVAVSGGITRERESSAAGSGVIRRKGFGLEQTSAR